MKDSKSEKFLQMVEDAAESNVALAKLMVALPSIAIDVAKFDDDRYEALIRQARARFKDPESSELMTRILSEMRKIYA